MSPFRIPEFDMPIASSGLSPAMDAVEPDMWAWAAAHQLVRGEAMRRHLARTRPQWATAIYLPGADEAHLRVPNRFMIWAFILDDNLDDSISEGHIESVTYLLDELVAVCRNLNTPVTNEGRALKEILDDLSQGRTRAWRNVLGESVVRWLNTFLPEARASRAGRVMTIDEYLPHRRNGVCEFIFAHLQEYVRDVELPKGVRDLPAMEQARNLACEWTGLYNDIYSVEKEESVGYLHNAVLVARTHRGCSTQEAVDIVAAITNSLLRQFLAACDAAPAQIRAAADYTPTVLAHASDVIDGYRDLVRANYDYHRGAARYSDVAKYMPEAITTSGLRPDWSFTPTITHS
ncbi:terpene synthase family protein [Streptomyces lanatus]|uniref:Terpene synthase n=1 Tax=Streptomyces lanatus TaxID=66900 RepID=A0ABV1XZ92_9ACTN|nr:terpene synthase family protein [Streptomyces lanatus]GHH18997.1 hypothetical protein GCM10018780_64080 [Streptomyces lanatus]